MQQDRHLQVLKQIIQNKIKPVQIQGVMIDAEMAMHFKAICDGLENVKTESTNPPKLLVLNGGVK